MQPRLTLDLGERSGSSDAEPRATLTILLCGLIATAIPFAIGVANILNHFYRQGAYLLDSGFLAYLMTQPDPSLPLPHSLGSGSFYAIHIAPIFSLLALLARLLPLSPPQFFAGFIGFNQALIAAAVFWALVGPIGLRRGFGPIVAAGLAIVFANDGLAIAILRYPHFEIEIAAAAMLFLVALHERRHGLAAVFLLLALITREDAGFHIALLLGTVIALHRAMRLSRDAERPLWLCLAAAFCYSAAAIALQHWAFPAQSSFARIYIGTPPFAHLTPRLVAVRLLGWSYYRSYAILPGFIAIAWAVWRRNPLIAAGYIAAVPWLVIHLLAISELAGTISSYYAFPLLIASFWPLLGVLKDRHAATVAQRLDAILGFALMLAASFTALSLQQNPNEIGFAATFAPPPSRAKSHAVERAIAALIGAKEALGTIEIDAGIASLAPDAFTSPEVFWAEATRPPDTMIYFDRGFEADDVQDRAKSLGLDRHYRLGDTSIQIATNRALEPVPALAPLLEREP